MLRKLINLLTFEWPARLMPGRLLRGLRSPKVLAGLAATVFVLSGVGFMAVAAWQHEQPAGAGERSAQALTDGVDDDRSAAGGSAGGGTGGSSAGGGGNGSAGEEDGGSWHPESSGSLPEPPLSGLTWPADAPRAVVTARGGVLVQSSPWHEGPAVNVLARGEQIAVACKTDGRDVSGNGIWFRLAGNPGFVAARYVRNVDGVPWC
ncbi:hypothetical protein ACFQLX_07845 [Streptomyces polyrhachis]|uniref:SH3 domain-containing protein n=1 Tax=Streptomyces polyrhachis TaxID=1282885 RepID=A0ABW2GB83_9ACTN